MNLKATLKVTDTLRAKQSIGGKGGGASDWGNIKNKPFETLGDDFTVENGELQLADNYATEEYVDNAVSAITPFIPVVSATSTLSTGTQIGSITIDGETTTFFAPSGGSGVQSVSYEDLTSGTGTQIGTLRVDNADYYVYAPSGGGGSVNIDNKSLIEVNGILQEAVPIYSEQQGGSGTVYGPGLYGDSFTNPGGIVDLDFYFTTNNFLTLATNLANPVYKCAIRFSDNTIFDAYWDATSNGSYIYGGGGRYDGQYELYIDQISITEYRLHIWMSGDSRFDLSTVEELCLYQTEDVSGFSNITNQVNEVGQIDDSYTVYHQLPAEYVPIDNVSIVNDNGVLKAAGGSTDWNDITNKPNFATVATSGSYSDLSNTPTIPTAVSQLTNDSNFATETYVNSATASIPTGSVVGITNTLQTGTAIADIDIDGVTTTLYAPAGGGGSGADWTATSGQSGYISNKPSIYAGVGTNAIREGTSTRADGESSHAEGNNTYANGRYSHAEGSVTQADGDASHSEGMSTYADGDYSHAEGNGTTSIDDASHAQGKFNAYEPFHYADMVGNGTSSSNRSNAEATDWNGNKYLAGDVYVGVTNWTTPTLGATKLAPVSITNTLATGTAIADIDIGGVTTTLYAPAGGGGNQADWAETDSTADSYIQNKPAVYAGTNNGVKIGTNSANVTAATNSLFIGNVYDTNYNPTATVKNDSLIVGSIRSAGRLANDDISADNGSIALRGNTGATYSKGVIIKADYGSIVMSDGNLKGEVTARYSSLAMGKAANSSASSTKVEIKAVNQSFAGGIAPKATGRQGIYAGYDPDTSTNGAAAIAFGVNVRAYKQGSASFGQYTEAQSPSQTAVGKYNVADANSIYNFIVGNGTAHASRSNSFAAGSDGNIYVSGDIYANVSDFTDPTNNGVKLAAIPAPPTTDGTYTLQVVVSNGIPTYSWI